MGNADAATKRCKVFKKYSHMKLQMKREALQHMNRRAGDSALDQSFDTEQDE